MCEETYNNWQKIRSKGRIRYIIRYGVLQWGIPTGVLFSILQRQLQLHFIIYNIGLFMAVGILFGVAMWWNLDKKARAYEEKTRGEENGE